MRGKTSVAGCGYGEVMCGMVGVSNVSFCGGFVAWRFCGSGIEMTGRPIVDCGMEAARCENWAYWELCAM